ncbi:uncharacterized protein [Henckelia pumila]|uniref:uncharacterized protein n=1 Tax=Henckelia pumila TaxID=405737 RepID=UPI003C6E3348
MAVGNGQNVMVFGICTAMGHETDMCPTFQEGSTEQVNAAGGFSGPPQRNYDPYSNTYNPGWKDHPNLRYGNHAMNQPTPPVNQSNAQAYKPPYHPQQQRSQIPAPGEFLENIVKDLATNTVTFQQEMRACIQHLNTQLGQLETTINMVEAQNSSSLLSQTVVNPKENVSAITLKSGRELKVHEEVLKEPVKNEEVEESKLEEDETSQKDTPRVKFPPLSEYKPVAPFPLALKESRRDDGIKGLYETFCRCEGSQRFELGEQVSAVIQRKIPTTCKDPGRLNETKIVVQMDDRSTIHHRGVLEDVFVQVDNLVFSADFYVLDMKNNDFNSPIFLGRPFLKTSNCESAVNILDFHDHLSQEHKTDVKEGKLKEASKTEQKLTPHRAKGISMGKGRCRKETEIPKKSKQRKHGPKLTAKLFRWVKVDKGTRYEPP